MNRQDEHKKVSFSISKQGDSTTDFSYIPPVWKHADACPTPEVQPSKKIGKNLRPISLTPVLSKGVESFACKWMKDLRHNIDPSQFVSVAKRSTVHTLVQFDHQWFQQLDSPGKGIRCFS